MLGSLKGFEDWSQKKWNFFPHRVALISKSVIPEIQKLLDETIRMVDYVKSRPLQSRLLPTLKFCHGSLAMGRSPLTKSCTSLFQNYFEFEHVRSPDL
jgi:hypothetical protein